MAKQKVTLTLDADVVCDARKATDNLSETVVRLLREFVREREREKLDRSLAEYADEQAARVKKQGVFGATRRKFL